MFTLTALAGPLLAGTTALFIATVVFLYQKRRDRAFQIEEEKRAAYRQFISSSEAYFARLRVAAFAPEMSDLDDGFVRMEADKSFLAIYGDVEVVDSCAHYAQALNQYYRTVRQYHNIDEADQDARRRAEWRRDEAYRDVSDRRLAAITAARVSARPDEAEAISRTAVAELYDLKSGAPAQTVAAET